MAGSVKKTGVNAGIEKGVAPQKFEGHVICKKCGKEIEFTLGSQLFIKCPRCGCRTERDLKKEEKQGKKVIKWDILRRSKKAQLSFGFTLVIISLAYNIAGFFTGLFGEGRWWLALVSLPLLFISYFCIKGTLKHSASKRYKFYAWLALWVYLAALIVVVVTAVPWLNDQIAEFLQK